MSEEHDPAPTFDGITHEEAVARARALAPRLRERAARAESARALPPETIDELHASGLGRALQPKRWSGMELEFIAYYDVTEALARGCASTAWNVSQIIMHHWMLAMYDERAQQEVWRRDPQAIIAAGIAFPQGRGRRADGGYVIGGRWQFASCVPTSEWCMVAATVREDGRVIDHRMCLLHKSQYEIVDDWRVMGMRATGSKSVRAADVFVPEHRALCMYLARGGDEFPGARANANPLYRVPLAALGSHCLAGAGVGNAQAAVEQTIAAIRERSTSYTALRMRDFQAVQLRVAAAGAKVDAARLVIRTDCLDAERIADEGRVPPLEDKLRFKRNVAWAIVLCTEAVDELHALAGANGIYDRYPIQRLFRDQHALSAHIGFSWDAQGGPWALVAMGGEFLSPTI